ncbi:MAG TPA: nuclear transport factor 2 family protein [Pseudonocardiaceae bacterium]|jgi:hypothetical protein|nr:nuclear transport factor 2 family protein [Pseudonocardiaceae bacterium]
MGRTVPEVIVSYFRASTEGDVDALLACFTEDAAVTDEGRTVHGHTEIRTWRKNVATAFTYTMEFLAAEQTGPAEHVSTYRLVGDFPGSPVDLRFRFELRGELIAALEIAP